MIPSENQRFLARVAYLPSGASKRQIPVNLSRWVVLSLFAVLAAHSGNAAAQEVQWRDAASFEIEGKGWPQTAGSFDRLPDSAKAKVNSTAWNLSKESAGICIRFTTDAAAVSVRWSLTSASLAMPHMPATGCSGLDLYARAADGGWRFVGNCRPGKQDGNQSTIEFPDGAKAKRECLLYLPAYNGTKSLEIGVPASSQVGKAAARPEGLRKPVIVYGTSITQGGCASRPGMIWTSILGRMLDRPVINLGFSASGDMAPPVGEALAEIDAAAYVIDCTWNMGTGKEMFLDHVTKLVQAIRKTHPVTPIVFMGQSMLRPDAHPTERTRDQDFAVQNLQRDGVQGLVIVPPNDFIGDDGEGTVDGVHYNDIGMQRQAQSLFPIVSMAVSGSMKPHVYIDTDTANEVDDPFAIYRALLAPEFNVVGLSSAGWGEPKDFETNTRTSQKMNEELLAMLDLTDRVSHPIGALKPMPAAATPVDSPAARDIIAKAKAMPARRKLQVFVLGAYTTVASALLLEPSIKDKMAVHVMGFRYDDRRLTPTDFNTLGDLHAAAHLLKSGVELKVMQNGGLGDFFWSKAELDAHFKGKGGVPDYLVKRWETHSPKDTQRILWDIAVFEAVLRPQLATLQEIKHEGATLHLWTRVDLPGMKADYWEATRASALAAAKSAVSVDPIVISKGGQAHSYQAFPDVCRLKNGDILVAFYAGYNHVSLATDDFPLGGRLCLVRSSDEGRTWTAPAVLYDDADDNRDPHLSQLDDGTVVCTFFSVAEKTRQRLKTLKDPKNYDLPSIETGVQIVLSRDNGKTWEPQAREAIPGWLCSAPVRQLPDGACVLGLYRGDEKRGLSVAGTACSTDRCRTWEPPVAIEAPEGVGLNAETDVIRLAEGRLYAAMRSYTDDMYYAISDDEAKSWTEAKRAGFPAHAPHLNRLSDGRIILSHRLPKTSIHVSHDDTKTWQGPYLIDSCVGAYPATVELKDHSILIVYYTEGGGSTIRARRLNLKPDGIEFLPL